MGGITHPCPECRGIGYIANVDEKVDSKAIEVVEETVTKKKSRTNKERKIARTKNRLRESFKMIATDIDQTLDNV